MGSEMKVKEKIEARRLRSEDGCSIREIAEKVGVSRGTVSVWVRDIELSSGQIDALRERNPAYNGQRVGGRNNRAKWAAKREEWRKQGMEEANKDWLHTAGCMLYWAEGWRKNNRSSVSFSNSDLKMVKLFVRFLRECYEVEDSEFCISINCYTDIRSAEECENYWIGALGLDRENLRKTICNKRPACTKRRRNGLLEYGTCKLSVHRADVLQRIYGALHTYAGFDKFD